ncbi:hypothetical protein LTR10_002988 [Elasticomyces elasticus]|nr:hypothetical protein LTR10_002988 [Elasticomyces elasticus]
MAPQPVDYNHNVGMDDLRRLQSRGASQRAGGRLGPGGSLGPSSPSDRNGSRRDNLGPQSARTNTPPADMKNEESSTDIAHGPSYIPTSYKLKADSATFVSKPDSAAMLALTNPAARQAYLHKFVPMKVLPPRPMGDDPPLNSNAHWSDSTANNNGSAHFRPALATPGVSSTEQKPASMSDVLAYLSNIQQGIASIDKGMIGIQREMASVKEQVNALPGIFAVLPAFIGQEVVSHVQDELLEPLGQRMSDLEQRFAGLQTAEDTDLTRSLAWPYNTAEAGAVFSEREISEPDDGLDVGGDDLLDSMSSSDAEGYDFKSFPFSYDNWYLPLGRGARGFDAVKWEAKYGRNEDIRQMAKSILDCECPGWAAQQQPWKPGDWM